MQEAAFDLAIVYPPTPESWDEAVEFAIELRRAGDRYGNWQLGWLAAAVGANREFGDANITKLAVAIGEAIVTLKKKRWVASGFTPEEVQAYPTLSFTHFEKVRALADEDREEARALLERAADENWSVERLDSEVHQTPLDKPAALRIEGPLITFQLATLLVDLADGTPAKLYIACPIHAGEQAAADMQALTATVQQLQRLLNPRLSAVRIADAPLLFQVGVQLPSSGAADWANTIAKLGLDGAFVRASYVRPI